MKVILHKDVKELGKSGALVEVSEGYARNFLFPRKIAVEATPAALRNLDEMKKAEARREEKALALAKVVGEEIAKVTVEVHAKSGEGGKLYGTITNKEIAAALAKQTPHEVDKRKIEMGEPIKALGTFNLTVKLHPQVTTTLRVHVTEG